MKIYINDDCYKCGICVLACPVDAIYEGAFKMEVNEEKCVLCQHCISVCPIEIIGTAPKEINNLVYSFKKKYWYAATDSEK